MAGFSQAVWRRRKFHILEMIISCLEIVTLWRISCIDPDGDCLPVLVPHSVLLDSLSHSDIGPAYLDQMSAMVSGPHLANSTLAGTPKVLFKVLLV